MDKQATDFALMASAFGADHKMATQVCRLLADGDVNESAARKMLALVRDGKLASETPTCSHWNWQYPYYSTQFPLVTTYAGVSVGGHSNSSLTVMANSVLENAA